jgi:hypothetical protein
LKWDELREAFDDALCGSLIALGLPPRDVQGMREYAGGMPSDYRGWLGFAAEKAEEYLVISRMDQLERPSSALSSYPATAIANAVVSASRSIAFSMREGQATLPFTMAVGLKALVACNPLPYFHP